MSKVLITGGGTAGHTNPGIAVAQALVELGVDRTDISFMGGERGNEGTLVPEAGFQIDLLPGRGILRSASPKAIRQNVGSVIGLVTAVVRGVRLVRAQQPDVVLCLGGYAAFAGSLAATLLRIPLVISEQNARASAVNRLFGRVAKVCALPYPDTDLPRGELTGNPIRQSVVDAVRNTEKSVARTELGLPQDRTIVAVWAGSLGARSINRAVSRLAISWADRSDICLYHVVGRRDWDQYGPETSDLASQSAVSPAASQLPGSGENGLCYQMVEYEDRMPLLLAAADIAVCRGGASTAAELAVAGLPSVLIPLPNAPRDHQRANGRELVEAGGAIQLDDCQLASHLDDVNQQDGTQHDVNQQDGNQQDGDELQKQLELILAQPETLQTMRAAARRVGRPGAARAVAEILLREAAR